MPTGPLAYECLLVTLIFDLPAGNVNCPSASAPRRASRRQWGFSCSYNAGPRPKPASVSATPRRRPVYRWTRSPG